MKEVVIVAAKRTAIGSFLGSLKNTKAVDMVSILSKYLIQELKVQKDYIDELILGQVLQGGQGQNIARQALLKSGISENKTAFLVNMVCGSGLKAVELGFNSISLNYSSLLLAGGVENMSLAPFLVQNMKLGSKMGNQVLMDTIINDGLQCALNNYHMGITAENLVKKYNISRQEQDEFAFNSHRKAAKAIEEGKFNDELLPLTIQDKKMNWFLKKMNL